MALYEVEMMVKVPVWKTVYVRAESLAEAEEAARNWAAKSHIEDWSFGVDGPPEPDDIDAKELLLPALIESTERLYKDEIIEGVAA